MDFEKLYQHSALLRLWLNLFIMIIIIVVIVSIFIIIIHRESATPQQWWHVGWMFITSLSSPGASTTSGPPYQQVQLFLLAHNSAFLGSFSRRKNSHNLNFSVKYSPNFDFLDLPWRTCENDWNTPSCRSPYEHKVMITDYYWYYDE